MSQRRFPPPWSRRVPLAARIADNPRSIDSVRDCPMSKCDKCRLPLIACACVAGIAVVGFIVSPATQDSCWSPPSFHAPSACALPVVDLPHDHNPERPGPSPYKITAAALSTATTSSTFSTRQRSAPDFGIA
jgi:hypothetical protein